MKGSGRFPRSLVSAAGRGAGSTAAPAAGSGSGGGGGPRRGLRGSLGVRGLYDDRSDSGEESCSEFAWCLRVCSGVGVGGVLPRRIAKPSPLRSTVRGGSVNGLPNCLGNGVG